MAHLSLTTRPLPTNIPPIRTKSRLKTAHTISKIIPKETTIIEVNNEQSKLTAWESLLDPSDEFWLSPEEVTSPNDRRFLEEKSTEAWLNLGCFETGEEDFTIGNLFSPTDLDEFIHDERSIGSRFITIGSQTSINNNFINSSQQNNVDDDWLHDFCSEEIIISDNDKFEEHDKKECLLNNMESRTTNSSSSSHEITVSMSSGSIRPYYSSSNCTSDEEMELLPRRANQTHTNRLHPYWRATTASSNIHSLGNAHHSNHNHNHHQQQQQQQQQQQHHHLSPHQHHPHHPHPHHPHHPHHSRRRGVNLALANDKRHQHLRRPMRLQNNTNTTNITDSNKLRHHFYNNNNNNNIINNNINNNNTINWRNTNNTNTTSNSTTTASSSHEDESASCWSHDESISRDLETHGGPGQGRLRLLEYVVYLLNANDPCVRWIRRHDKTFEIVDSTRLSHLWGCYKRNTPLSFNSVCRSLRLYYKDGTLKRQENARNTYQILRDS